LFYFRASGLQITEINIFYLEAYSIYTYFIYIYLLNLSKSHFEFLSVRKRKEEENPDQARAGKCSTGSDTHCTKNL